MGLTFDEFGMWLHLGGGYWQRASYDAVIVILGSWECSALRRPSPRCERITGWPGRHDRGTGLFYLLLFKSVSYVDKKESARFEQLEQKGPQ